MKAVKDGRAHVLYAKSGSNHRRCKVAVGAAVQGSPVAHISSGMHARLHLRCPLVATATCLPAPLAITGEAASLRSAIYNAAVPDATTRPLEMLAIRV